MNALTIIVLLVLAFFAGNGYIKGFVRMLASMFLFVLTAVLVYYATPYVSSFLGRTPLKNVVEETCMEFLENSIKEEADEGEMSRNEQGKWMEELQLPEILKKQLQENNNHFVYEQLMAKTFEEYVVRYLTEWIIHICSYILCFILLSAGLRAIVAALDILARLPVLKSANRILGLGLGLVQGVGMIWLVCLVLTVFSHTDYGKALLVMVEESPFLRVLYHWNLFLKCLEGLF